MAGLYAATLFVSATLLFLVQPMIAKMILPKFGGTPAVWNTCMLFFQALLLAGYSYAHATTSWLGTRRQAALQLAVLLLPVIALSLPLSIKMDPPGGGNPVFWLLFLLLISVGLPFFVISTSAPLLQKWFASTGHPSAEDPYFLYAASNLGSMLALVAYPVWMEPTFRLPNQSWIWTIGYALLVALAACCAFVLWRSPEEQTHHKGNHKDAEALDPDAPNWVNRLHWVGLAFVPSSLMLGVTTYLSTDIAAIPLIWVIPLGLYLLSFILVFSKLPSWIHTFMVLSLPVLILLQLYLMLSETSQSMRVLISLHLATLFVVAMVCHGELARNRPDTRYLTEFYLWMSFGGVLGGLFNAMFAPMVFNSVLEYPLAMVVACLLMPRLVFDETDKQKGKNVSKSKEAGWEALEVSSKVAGRASGVPFLSLLARCVRWLGRVLPPTALDFVLPALLGLATGGIIIGLDYDEDWMVVRKIREWMEFFGSAPELYRLRKALMYGVPALICYAFVNRPLRFGLGVGAILLAGGIYARYEEQDSVLMRHRSFFGVLKLEKTTIQCSLDGRLLDQLRKDEVPDAVIDKLAENLQMNKWYAETTFKEHLSKILDADERAAYGDKIYEVTDKAPFFHRLVHGTTLHGTQRCDGRTRKPLRNWFRFTDCSMTALREQGIPDDVLSKLKPMVNKDFFPDPLNPDLTAEENYLSEVRKNLSTAELEKFEEQLLAVARSADPLTYYHRTGPLGQVFEAFRKAKKTQPLALIGLGTGSIAGYGEPGQELTYFEIDQAVVDIATDEKYFSYWTDAKRRGVNINVVMGDARLSLADDGKVKQPDASIIARAPDGHFQLIVVDAFSSDAIPIHLITHEALELYRKKLAPGGIVAFHISNRYLDLEPVCYNLARATGMKGIVNHDSKDDFSGKTASTWVMLAEDEDSFLSLGIKKNAKDKEPWYRFEDNARWDPDSIKPSVGIWSDDFSNILSVFMWRN